MIKTDYSDKNWLHNEPNPVACKPWHGLTIAIIAGLLIVGVPVPVFPIHSEI